MYGRWDRTKRIHRKRQVRFVQQATRAMKPQYKHSLRILEIDILMGSQLGRQHVREPIWNSEDLSKIERNRFIYQSHFIVDGGLLTLRQKIQIYDDIQVVTQIHFTKMFIKIFHTDNLLKNSITIKPNS